MVCARDIPRFGGFASRFKPYASQWDAWKEILLALARHKVALDFSDTGVGKTFHALMVASQLRLKPCIITPKVVIPGFEDATRLFDMGAFVVNYEHLHTNGNRFVRRKRDGTFEWLLDPDEYMIIYDEGHRIRNDTLNGRIALSAYEQGFHCLIATATPFSSPLDLAIIGQMLGLHKGGADFRRYCLERGCEELPPSMGGGLTFDRLQPGVESIMDRINAEAVIGRGTRIRRDQCDGFMNTVIRPLVLDLGRNAEVVNAATKAYAKQLGDLGINLEFARIQAARAEERGNMKMLRAYKGAARKRLQQIAELQKVPAIAAMATTLLSEGKQVVVFLNYQESIMAFATVLKAKLGFITGEHPDREKTVRRFQNGELDAVVCQFQAGGAGVSLHHIKGKRPRASILSPNDSMNLTKQALGRIWRRGALSDCEQYIVFAGGTVEEAVARKFVTLFRHQDLCLDKRVSVEALDMAAAMNRGDHLEKYFDLGAVVSELYYAHEDEELEEAA